MISHVQRLEMPRRSISSGLISRLMQIIPAVAMAVAVVTSTCVTQAAPENNLVNVLVRSDNELLVERDPQSKEQWNSTLDQIKQDGKSLAIRAESAVSERRLCEILAECRRKGIEPSEFADQDGQPILHYAGTVVDPEGKPAAQAGIRLSYFREAPRVPDAPAEAESDEQGRFEFIRRMSDFRDAAEDAAKKSLTVIIAIKAGYGFALGNSSFCLTTYRPPETPQRKQLAEKLYRGTPNVLRLVMDDQPIQGRVVDRAGKGVANARVEGVNTYAGDGTLDAWEAACALPNANYYSTRSHLRQTLQETYRFGFQASVIPPVVTDADGRFTLKGIGRERIEHIIVSGPGIESIQFNARTRDGKTISLPHDTRGNPTSPREVYYPREFSVVVGPSQAITGQITDLKTGKPLTGVLLRGERLANVLRAGWLAAGHIRAVTDHEGRYRLTGLPIGVNTCLAVPPAGSASFPAQIEFTTVDAPDEQVRDLTLTSGILLKGTITDATTGMPIRGLVQYLPDLKNPLLESMPKRRMPSPFDGYPCDASGRFALPVLPGAGVLTFAADNHRMFPRSSEAEGQDPQVLKEARELINGPGQIFVSIESYHAVRLLQVAVDARELTENITLRSGRILTGRVVTADGKPVSEYYLHGDTAPSTWRFHSQEQFSIYGYFPQSGRRLMVWDPRTNQIGTLDLQGEVNDPVTVGLKPGGRIIGRVVDENGNPQKGVPINNALARPHDPVSAIGATSGEFVVQMDNRPILTNDDGRFELSGVIPGHQYAADVSIPGVVRDRKTLIQHPLFRDVSVRPGETKDLGDLKPEKRQAPRVPGPQESIKK